MHDETPDPIDNAPEPDAEAGGRHLAYSLGRIPWLVWAFVLLAIGDAFWYVRNLNLPATASISDVAVYGLQVIPPVIAVLLPAVLLARHPDATSRARTLLFGTILFALVQGLVILSEPLQGFFQSMTPPSQDLPGLVPLAEFYSGLINLVTAFGLAYIAIGLSQARQLEDHPRSVTTLFVPVAAIFGMVVEVLWVSGLQLGDTPMSPTLAIDLGASVVLGVLRIVVWVYLATAIVRGLLAGEDPRSGWLLGALGGGLVILALVLFNLNRVVDIQDQTLVTVYGYVVILAYALGYVSLLAAFAVGLPAFDEFDDEDDFDDVDDFDDEEEFEHGHEDEFEDAGGDEYGGDEPGRDEPGR